MNTAVGCEFLNCVKYIFLFFLCFQPRVVEAPCTYLEAQSLSLLLLPALNMSDLMTKVTNLEEKNRLLEARLSTLEACVGGQLLLQSAISLVQSTPPRVFPRSPVDENDSSPANLKVTYTQGQLHNIRTTNVDGPVSRRTERNRKGAKLALEYKNIVTRDTVAVGVSGAKDAKVSPSGGRVGPPANKAAPPVPFPLTIPKSPTAVGLPSTTTYVHGGFTVTIPTSLKGVTPTTTAVQGGGAFRPIGSEAKEASDPPKEASLLPHESFVVIPNIHPPVGSSRSPSNQAVSPLPQDLLSSDVMQPPMIRGCESLLASLLMSGESGL